MVAAMSSASKSQRMIELKFAQAELASLQSLQNTLQRQQELMDLQQATDIDDAELLERLHAAGFRAQNVKALAWLPIALAAWASHGVSNDEVHAARLVNLYALFTGNAQSTELFQSWLKEKPSEKLVKLWEETTRRQLARAESSWRLQTGQAILYMARKVAQASGGLFGMGQISVAEQRVLDRIRAVYGIMDEENWD